MSQLRIVIIEFPINFIPCSLLPTPYSLFPDPMFPVSCSQIRCSLCYIAISM
ncbi:hypothetical protein BJP36_38480 [Moorena producens JHB]|uniref:Uncharacterized protein n=1 Tax=Moorena producens (strain JHB) TaxID=1454205 RepID=A0A9Q9SUN5_MOOP1|nr:hypothetical protein [Moorena producens]WAN69967.1 hypothetical protein BJP36_38480 [Moorena producens JHB]